MLNKNYSMTITMKYKETCLDESCYCYISDKQEW